MSPTIVGVYRVANAPIVEALIGPALADGWSTAWWALDAIAPVLAEHTVGVGPGEKLPVLNETLRRHGPMRGALLLSDDDIAVRRGSLSDLVALCVRARLDLAQPAHAPGSNVSHGITRAQPRSRVRLTTFVEGGPLVVVMPTARERVLPLPESRGMGWGIELDWIDFQRQGMRLGIVDAVTVTHLEKVAATYDDTELRAAMRAELDTRGVDDWAPFQRTLGVWRPWQRRAPWVSAEPRLRRRAAPRTGDEPRTLLVDLWYSHAVGHVLEALRRCQAYHAADPTLRISLVLNGASPVELARCAPFVENVFGVDFTNFGQPQGSPAVALRAIPRAWDHVVRHAASIDPYQARFEGLRRYYEASRRHFRGRLSEGIAGQPPPEYVPHQELRLALPDREREHARLELGGRRAIAVMLAGSSTLRALYPSTSSWIRILAELEHRLPETTFVFIGLRQARGGRTVSGISSEEIERIAASCSSVCDYFDRPILEQLAAVEACSLFVSPHTGFGFAAVSVGTPWLTLSGGDWHEYFFNGVPFHSVLPKRPDYPPFVHSRPLPMIAADIDGEGPRTSSMGAGRILEDLDELGEAAVALVEGRVSYDDALADYFPRLLEAYGGDRSLVATFEELDREFLP